MESLLCYEMQHMYTLPNLYTWTVSFSWLICFCFSQWHFDFIRLHIWHTKVHEIRIYLTRDLSIQNFKWYLRSLGQEFVTSCHERYLQNTCGKYNKKFMLVIYYIECIKCLVNIIRTQVPQNNEEYGNILHIKR